jgi:hypothetical protein
MAESAESSDDQRLQSESILIYEKNRFTKVTFNSDTKRFCDAPKDYELLVSLIYRRFPVLKLVVEHAHRP